MRALTLNPDLTVDSFDVVVDMSEPVPLEVLEGVSLGGLQLTLEGAQSIRIKAPRQQGHAIAARTIETLERALVEVAERQAAEKARAHERRDLLLDQISTNTGLPLA